MDLLEELSGKISRTFGVSEKVEAADADTMLNLLAYWSNSGDDQLLGHILLELLGHLQRNDERFCWFLDTVEDHFLQAETYTRNKGDLYGYEKVFGRNVATEIQSLTVGQIGLIEEWHSVMLMAVTQKGLCPFDEVEQNIRVVQEWLSGQKHGHSRPEA